MAEDFDTSLLEDPPEVVEGLLADAVEAAAVEGQELGGVDVTPGEIVGVVDGVEIRHLTDESDHVLPITFLPITFSPSKTRTANSSDRTPFRSTGFPLDGGGDDE
jgi:hypothetical protein